MSFAACSPCPLEQWLSREAEDGGKYDPDEVTRLLRTVSWQSRRHITPVTSRFMMTDFKWQTNELVIEDIGAGERADATVVSSPPWLGSSIHLIAAWTWPPSAPTWDTPLSKILAYSNNSGSTASLLLIACPSGSVEWLADWDLSLYWMRSAVTMGRIGGHAEFGCSVSSDRRWLLLLGPSASHFSSWGCALYDLETKAPAQHITVDGYKWAAAAVLPPGADPEYAALVCCKRPEYVENFARPNTCGTLLKYDFRAGRPVQALTGKSASTEVVKFTPDSLFLIVRINRDRCLAILAAQDFSVVRTVAHDVDCFLPNHFSFTLLYPTFPLVSRDGTELAVLQGGSGGRGGTAPITTPGATPETTGNSRALVACLPLPLLPTLSLRARCRSVVWQRITRPSDVIRLPLPTALLDFIMWK